MWDGFTTDQKLTVIGHIISITGYVVTLLAVVLGWVIANKHMKKQSRINFKKDLFEPFMDKFGHLLIAYQKLEVFLEYLPIKLSFLGLLNGLTLLDIDSNNAESIISLYTKVERSALELKHCYYSLYQFYNRRSLLLREKYIEEITDGFQLAVEALRPLIFEKPPIEQYPLEQLSRVASNAHKVIKSVCKENMELENKIQSIFLSEIE